MRSKQLKPRAGDWMQVRPAADILATLDASGSYERLPFMAEMLRHAGRRFQVSAVAHKTCDTVNRTGGRMVDNTVHLSDLRCDGSAHGGCQADCLFFWKREWLEPVSGPGIEGEQRGGEQPSPALLEPLARHASSRRADGVEVFRCQATTLPEWTAPLAWWDLRQYWRDVRNGNVGLRHALTTLVLASIYRLRDLPIGYRASCWLYAKAHQWLRGMPDPHGIGPIPRGQPTPDGRLNLQVGEVVRIRSRDEIYATVNEGNFNRGLQVDEEMTKYCGGQFRVTNRVTQIINERTGEMMHFKNPCIVLDGVNCTGDYSAQRLLCPRRITAYWRELWLERADQAPSGLTKAK